LTDDGLTLKKIWRRGQHGWPASYPVMQPPNVPLLVALARLLLAALTGGLVHHCARETFYTGLAAWAWKEIDDGANLARRAIGAVGVVFVIAKITDALRT
jgi:hypothetical protein